MFCFLKQTLMHCCYLHASAAPLASRFCVPSALRCSVARTVEICHIKYLRFVYCRTDAPQIGGTCVCAIHAVHAHACYLKPVIYSILRSTPLNNKSIYTLSPPPQTLHGKTVYVRARVVCEYVCFTFT